MNCSRKMCCLSLHTAASFTKQCKGFYRSSYTDKDGTTRKMASSQFESEWARLAFPCWDEPIYKATFDVELEVRETFTALSNMHVEHEEKTSDGFKLLRFATTPKMSSYLVAFAVGDFEYIEVRLFFPRAFHIRSSICRRQQKAAFLRASIRCLARRRTANSR